MTSMTARWGSLREMLLARSVRTSDISTWWFHRLMSSSVGLVYGLEREVAPDAGGFLVARALTI